MRELLTGYGPVCLIWFDTPYLMNKERSQRFIDMVHQLQPATLNRTWGYKKDDNQWKTPEDLTFKLVDIVSKGGNYCPATAWRCTTKLGRLYLHLFKWPGASFELNGLKEKVTKAYLLSNKRSALKVKQVGDKLTVALPRQPADQAANVLALETRAN